MSKGVCHESVTMNCDIADINPIDWIFFLPAPYLTELRLDSDFENSRSAGEVKIDTV